MRTALRQSSPTTVQLQANYWKLPTQVNVVRSFALRTLRCDFTDEPVLPSYRTEWPALSARQTSWKLRPRLPPNLDPLASRVVLQPGEERSDGATAICGNGCGIPP